MKETKAIVISPHIEGSLSVRNSVTIFDARWALNPTEVNVYHGELSKVIGKYKFRVCDNLTY